MDPNNDEHDLAKALDSVAAELSAKAAARSQQENNTEPGTVSFEEAKASATAPVAPPVPAAEPAATPSFSSPAANPYVPEDAASATPPPYFGSNNSAADDLESIKKDALVELRPLVDKLSVSPEEKFDTYLLLIRSTDDKELIAPAHEAAKAITDEARRAEALLDIIKEIDYLSKK